MSLLGGHESPEVEMSNEKHCQRVDQYGFEHSEDVNHEEMMSEYVTVLTSRAEKWSKLLKEDNKVDKNLKVKRYVRKGVPNEHRALIWMAASGAQQHLQMNPGHYASLLKARHDQKLEESIRTDLNRTFPDNIHFRDSSQMCLQTALYNVLLAYGQHNKDVGYCQGMNFIAGYLLIITSDEEKSFWLMDALVGRILPDYYTPAMMGLKTDQEVLGELVRVKVPAVWRAMTQHNVMWTLVVSRWFLCLYIDVLPMETGSFSLLVRFVWAGVNTVNAFSADTLRPLRGGGLGLVPDKLWSSLFMTVLRIWDCLFYEGSKILFRVALTLIRHHQNLIQKAQSLPDICECYKQVTRGEFVEDCHTFMKRIFSEPGSLSMSTITKLRESCRRAIQAQESGH